jgi:Na+-transporting methylmalonyl-CoA/oxaloacetate decarboxylase gamma subunit
MFGNRKQLSYVLLIAFAVFVSGTFVVNAALKDSDVDGVTDDAEINSYHTNPNNHDTDGDGFDDGYEIVHGSDPLDAKSMPLTATRQPVATIFSSGIPADWHINQMGGIVAFIFFLIFVIRGLSPARVASLPIPIPVKKPISDDQLPDEEDRSLAPSDAMIPPEAVPVAAPASKRPIMHSGIYAAFEKVPTLDNDFLTAPIDTPSVPIRETPVQARVQAPPVEVTHIQAPPAEKTQTPPTEEVQTYSFALPKTSRAVSSSSKAVSYLEPIE